MVHSQFKTAPLLTDSGFFPNASSVCSNFENCTFYKVSIVETVITMEVPLKQNGRRFL